MTKEKGKEETRRPTLKEIKEVKYTFDDEDVETILDELLTAKAIKLPEPKRPAEVDKTNDPQYCRYRRIVSHPLKDCSVLKNIIQEKINNHEIEVDSSSKQQTATSNIIECGFSPSVPLSEEVIPVGFHVDKEATVVHAYPDMPRSGNPNVPTLYELMTAPSLDIWEDSSYFSDESQSKWQTVVKRGVKNGTYRGVKIACRPFFKNKKLKKKISEK